MTIIPRFFRDTFEIMFVNILQYNLMSCKVIVSNLRRILTHILLEAILLIHTYFDIPRRSE